MRGVGPRIAQQLEKIAIHSIQDLLFHLPQQYQDRTRITPINRLKVGEHAVIEGEVSQVKEVFQPRRSLSCRISDGSGSISLRFFHFNKAQQLQFSSQLRLRCYGEIRLSYSGLEMIHPEYRLLSAEFSEPVETCLTGIYPTTEGLQQLSLRKLTDQALALLAQGCLEELLPESILQQFGLTELSAAVRFVHRPPPSAPKAQLLAGSHPAQQRLAMEELLAHQLSLQQSKQQWRSNTARILDYKKQAFSQFFTNLAFELTAAQQRVFAEVSRDLSIGQPMLRLIQGDVGSGKTVVAAAAMLQAVSNGYQAVLMAPTELLAEQHFSNLDRWFSMLGYHCVNLTGTLKAAEKRSLVEQIAGGQAQIIVGTHALFQKGIAFNNVALIVVDEQHRFGVNQRLELWEKGQQQNYLPHQLIMTATPIPRTLAMTAYADLDYSVIDELPPGRTPVTTVLISNQRRLEIVARIHQACKQGRQIYWVCTLIEDSEVLQCQAAEATAADLQQSLPDVRIGLIHGRLKPTEKDQLMQSFRAGEIDLLVATTVIEVGVDVPNATLMIIENPERLGLAQLHQLRGRVGRGQEKSHCVLMYQLPLGELARKRLSVMKETNDGFAIAQYDLELRGPGEVLGTRQAGLMQLKIADLLRDKHLLPQVQEISALLLNKHPQCIPGLIKRWIPQGEKYASV